MFRIVRRLLAVRGPASQLGVRNYCSEGKGILTLSEEVKDAVHHGNAVVALESTIITHGMPYPQNLNTALEVEQVVRSNGAVPATVGILNGNIKVGLSKNEVEYLADPSTSAVKTSRRDLPIVISEHQNGGMTVSGTMIAAAMVGIPIFITGGIGGVHRGAENSMDISADLTELGRTPVTVVSAGVKSILDIGRTLEYMETQGVCVASFGDSRDFPAFFAPKSGHKAPYMVGNSRKAAEMIHSHSVLGLSSGVLIAVPIPDKYAEQGVIIEQAIQTAVQEASDKGIMGKEVTPYILERVNQITEGASLEANIHLVKNNAKIGSQIAVELSNLRRSETTAKRNEKTMTYKFNVQNEGKALDKEQGRVVVIGGSIVDFYARVNTEKFTSNGATYPGTIQQSFGGVGRNLVDSLSRLQVNPLFISAVGNDSHKMAYQAYCSHMDLSGVRSLDNKRTATYCAMLEGSGRLLFGIGDMDIHSCITPQFISEFESQILSAPLVCLDGNIQADSIGYVCTLCHKHDIPVWFEPTDLHKAGKPFENSAWRKPFYTSPNLNELRQMYRSITGSSSTDDTESDIMTLNAVLEESLMLAQVVTSEIPVVMVTLGKHGVLLCYNKNYRRLPLRGDNLLVDGDVVADHYQAAAEDRMPSSIVNVSGAGDCLNAGIIRGMIQGDDLDLCVKTGLLAAQFSLHSHHAIPDTINKENLTRSKVIDWAPWSAKRYKFSSRT